MKREQLSEKLARGNDLPGNRSIGLGVIGIAAFLMILMSGEVEDLQQQGQPGTAATVTGQETESISAEEQAFIDDSFSALTSWDYETLRTYLDAATLQGMSEDELRRVLSTLQLRLGTLLYHEQPELVADLSNLNLEIEAGLQAYRFSASFEKGPAQVYLVIDDEQNERHLYAFNIQSG